MFLSPLALLGIGLLALPLFIHALARRHARRFDFPSLEFIRQTKNFRLRPRRIQDPLLLVLRLIALLLVIAGLARPLFPGATSHMTTHVILIDSSLSMSVPGTAAAAKDAARSVISKLAPGEQAGIITFSSGALVLSDPSHDKAGLTKALDTYATDAAATDFKKGFVAAVEMFERTPDAVGTIDLISDFQSNNLESARNIRNLPPKIHLNPIAVGHQLSRNSFVDRCVIDWSAGGLAMRSREISVNGDARHGVVNHWPMSDGQQSRPGFTWAMQPNGEITGSINTLTADEFDGDDQHYFAFDTPRERRALVIESQSEAEPFFQAALKASGVPAVPVSVDKQSEVPSNDKLAWYSLVVFTVDKDLSASDLSKLSLYVKQGGTLWLQLSPSLNTTSPAPASSTASELFPFQGLTRIEKPVQKSLGSLNIETGELHGIGRQATTAFSGIGVKRHFQFKKRDIAAALLQWSDGEPALLAAQMGQGTVLCWPFTLNRSTTSLGVTPAFPVLIATIFNNIAATRNNSQELGQPVWLDTKPDTQVTVSSKGTSTVLTDSRTLIQHSLQVIRTPGIYRIQYEGKERFLAFNSPASESEISLATPNQVQSVFSVAPSEDPINASNPKPTGDTYDRLWRVLMACAFLFLATELLFWIRDQRRKSNEIEF